MNKSPQPIIVPRLCINDVLKVTSLLSDLLLLMLSGDENRNSTVVAADD